MNRCHHFTENTLNRLFNESGEEFILLETAQNTHGDHHSYLFKDAEKHLRHHAGEDPYIFLTQCQAYIKQGYYLAGWLSYEFGYTLDTAVHNLSPVAPGTLLANLGLYPSCQVFDHHQSNPPIPAAQQPVAKPCQISGIRLSQSKEEYIEHIKTIQKYILAGDTYQVNYTLKLFFEFLGCADNLYLQLRRNQQVSFAAYIKEKEQTIMSFSPELFFKKDGKIVTVRPMKGTIARGRTRKEDDANSRFLQNDPKSRAENVMIVDLLRNDLGKIALSGKVTPTSLFDVETYNSLLQMTSTIKAEVKGELHLAKLFKALFPCGSVTGAPKIRTMEIIRELETEPRGVYTGAIGFISPDGGAQFNVPIRTLVLEKNRGHMGIGSGIVADSNPEQEWQECLLKGHFLTHSRNPFELIETLLWQPNSGFMFTELHRARLEESAAYFNFVFSKKKYNELLTKIAGKLQETSRVRITLNPEGIFTSTTTGCPPPAPFKPLQPKSKVTLKVCFSRETTASYDPFLQHKTTNRTLYNDTWSKATDGGYLDAIFTNEKGEITEGCISTIFLLKNGVLLTPPVTAGLLPGVFRQYLLAQFPTKVKEQTLYKEDVLAPDTILCIGNSVRGLIPVDICDDWLV
jgi:para-aminobenzoate synthetase/4-amino-4-deoxychorismate lyase